jgi:TIGR03009 family protein
MRKSTIAIGAVLTVASLASSQPANQLDKVVKDWEKAMTGVQSFAVEIERIETDKSLGTETKYKGFALFNKGDQVAGLQARLRLEKAGNAEHFQQYIVSDGKLYEYVAAAKVVRVVNVPKNQINIQQQELFSTLFEIGVKEAKTRYKLNLEQKNPPDGYYYLHVEPKDPADKARFIQARLAVAKANSLLAQIWYVQPSREEVVWNFRNHQVNVKIGPGFFKAELPAGWAMQQANPPLVPVGKGP